MDFVGFGEPAGLSPFPPDLPVQQTVRFLAGTLSLTALSEPPNNYRQSMAMRVVIQ